MPTTIIYARTHTRRNRSELERHISILKNTYPYAEVVYDYGHGLDFNRSGLNALIRRISNGEVNKVVAMTRSTLMERGYMDFRKICRRNRCKISIHQTSRALFLWDLLF